MIKQAAESYAAPELEARIQAFWDTQGLYERAKEHGREGTRFPFVDGPPYTTGSVHVGTARNKIIKDAVLRWLRMRGYDVRDTPGYDMHGLPIEVLVERALGITNKRQIEEEVGVAAFVTKCREFAMERLERMTAEFRDMGVWMDWDRPYMTVTNDYIESAWWTLQRAHERGLLVEAKRSLEWCPRCETPVAGYEIEFWDETDPSVYVRFPLEDGGSLLIWTTTPWTLPANLAVAVHPAFTYAWVRYRVDGSEDHLWVVEDHVEQVMEAAGVEAYEVERRASGSDLVGLRYRHPLLEEVPAQTSLAGEWIHRVLPSETVTLEFTGLVHTAPGHGPEDFAIGQERGLPPFSPLDDRGRFTADGGRYEGLSTAEGTRAILEDLETKGLLFHQEELTHRYGHCWRCDTPILYRATDQWFIRVTQLKERMLSEVRRVTWVPEWAGSARQFDWVANAKDWTISRQRYWGIPMPLWRCGEGHLRVVGSTEELAGSEGFEEGMDLHRPWIDAVRLTCAECGQPMDRIPDVLDVWFDSAVASWASLGYPRRTEAFEEEWPAPWITEAHDQTRGWFYSQLGAGVVAFDRCPYDSVLMHGWIWPEEGEAFSKSRGGNITPGDVAEEHGMDALRFYELKAAPPWDDFAFLWDEVRNAHRTLNILWNVHRFATLYMALDAFDPTELSLESVRPDMRPEDRWMLSRLQGVVEEADAALTGYEFHRLARSLEEFLVRDLSRWYVRLARDRTWTEESDEAKGTAYRVLHEVLLTTVKLLAPLTPFVAEAIYQDLDGPLATVHMEDWPEARATWRDEALEARMAQIRAVVDEVGRLRQRRSYKLRWPVPRVVVAPEDEDVASALSEMGDILGAQTNAKRVEVLPPGTRWALLRRRVRPLQAPIGRSYKSWLPEIVAALERADPEEVRRGVEEGTYEIQVKGQPVQITPDMVEFHDEVPPEVAAGEVQGVSVYVDFEQTPAIEAEGFARELVRRIQEMRKEMDLAVDASVLTQVQCAERLRGFFEEWQAYVRRETRSSNLSFVSGSPGGDHVKAWDVEGERLVIGITLSE